MSINILPGSDEDIFLPVLFLFSKLITNILIFVLEQYCDSSINFCTNQDGLGYTKSITLSSVTVDKIMLYIHGESTGDYALYIYSTSQMERSATTTVNGGRRGKNDLRPYTNKLMFSLEVTEIICSQYIGQSKSHDHT